MRVIVTGATGFIGRPLVRHLATLGHSCIVLTRKKSHAMECGYTEFCTWDEPLPEADAVIHLAGESVVGLWTKRKRAAILKSRTNTTRRLVTAMNSGRPKVFLAASAVGYYGNRPNEILTESSTPDPFHGFRFTVCKAWETEANLAIQLGVRVVNLRMGNVLHPSGGYLGKMIPLYRHGLCIIPGAPNSVMSWISLDDTIRMITFALEHHDISGPLNVTSPHPVTQREFATTLAKRSNRKVCYQIPSWLLRLSLGEFSSAVLDSQHVIPLKAQQNGFTFNHGSLKECIKSAL